MKSISKFLCALSLVLFTSNLNAQCNTATTICTSGIAGPYTFAAPGAPVSTCLDFFGPSYTYIVLYITQSGPLEMLIDGDASNGFLDVAIFNVPTGIDPCVAINTFSNEISSSSKLAFFAHSICLFWGKKMN